MTKLIAAILTKNENKHVTECIKSVQWADAAILEDSFSTDGTVETARGLGAVVYQNEFVNFAVARNNALKTRSRWAPSGFFSSMLTSAQPRRWQKKSGR